jgi:cell division protein FtsB
MKAHLSRFACVLALLAVVSCAFVTLRGPRGVSAWLEKKREIQTLEQRNIDLNKEIERALERIDRIAKDPSERQRIARERLNYVDKNDKVYVTPDPAPPQPEPAGH